MNGLQLDGVAIDQNGWTNIPGSAPPMVGKALNISTGIHYLRHTGGTNFGASVYGNSPSTCSYAYPAGQCTKDLQKATSGAGMYLLLYIE